ncbi:MAG: hypothetical protein LBL34_01265 [Clostridiales bacterium]|jgi:phosphopantothenate-cysteine ligase|nr:hypothetical protein [Clostridiales bacterium]
MRSVLITGGGTIENIDNVRGITNFATGRLGSLIADEFADSYKTIYICGQNACLPRNADVSIIRIKSTEDLAYECRKTLENEQIDAIIHSMAVSDYCVDYVTDATGEILQRGKISSQCGELILHLRKTPKVIAMFKDIAPKSMLVGFKLLSDANRSAFVPEAQRLLRENSCDMVVINRLEDISGDKHIACLVDKDGAIAAWQTKSGIAKGVFEHVEKCFAGREREHCSI